MEQKRYVQHKSGQGEKWEVVLEVQNGWKVSILSGLAMGNETWFPKSEYRLCEPEEWEDITEHCSVGDAVCMTAKDGIQRLSILFNDPETYVNTDIFHPCQVSHFNVQKIDHIHNGPCFIVERKKS